MLAESGRPDLNRGPPAPKAGAIPGYATPRSEGKLLYPALGAQRAQQGAECTAAMTAGCRILDRRFGKCACQFGCLEIRIVAESTGATRTREHSAFYFAAARQLASFILECSDGDVARGISKPISLSCSCVAHASGELHIIRRVERVSLEILGSRPALAEYT